MGLDVGVCSLQHRLRNCGLSNVIYLVEEYGSMEHFKLPEETLNQAVVNTQVFCYYLAVLILIIVTSTGSCFGLYVLVV